MKQYIFTLTTNTVALTLTNYESQNYLCNIYVLVLDRDMLVGSLCYVWKDFFFLTSS